MAAPSAHAGGATDRPRGAKHRRPLLSHLQVPAVSASNNGWFGRPSGPTTAPAATHAHAHAARPASPSLLRSPSAWIRAKGHSFGSSSKHAAPSRPGNFHYDAGSYARNFDDGDGDDVDAFRLRCFSPRIVPTSPGGVGGGGGGGKGDGNEPHRETAR